ncbi:DUF7344 domain-containing protein [Natronorubrum halophilum]|uniref:DUF7344 domain-containing protein n=1 Tax=Natronorubrum halophilum TaxID=1702106 RepID=UPI000EF6C26A|nr:hypothetical protein [Natronorubrum halophilum]
MTPTTNRPLDCSDDPANSTQSDEALTLSQDEIFHILQTSRRRDVIDYLLDKSGPVKMGEIAEHVAAKENDTTVANLTSTQRQRVYIPLYQSHLSKLDEKGLIEYDKPRGIVRPTDEVEKFRPYLEATNEDIDRRAAGLSHSIVMRAAGDYNVPAICASISLLAAFAGGFVRISGVALGTLIVGLFVLARVATTVTTSRSSNRSIDTRSTH